MTGTERRKQKILQRRVERRAARRAAQNKPYDDFLEVFSYEHLYNTYLKQRTKLLKTKTGQRFCINAPLNLLHLHTTLMAGNYKCAKFAIVWGRIPSVSPISRCPIHRVEIYQFQSNTSKSTTSCHAPNSQKFPKTISPPAIPSYIHRIAQTSPAHPSQEPPRHSP